MVYKKIVKFFKHLFKKKRKVARKKKRQSLKKKITRRKIQPKPLKRKKQEKRKPRRVVRKKNQTKKKTKKTAKGKVPVLVAEVTHYFPKVNAAVIKIKKSLTIGMPILVKGNKTNFKQTIGSMQINRKPIERAARGQEVGLEVFRVVEPGDGIYEVKV